MLLVFTLIVLEVYFYYYQLQSVFPSNIELILKEESRGGFTIQQAWALARAQSTLSLYMNQPNSPLTYYFSLKIISQILKFVSLATTETQKRNFLLLLQLSLVSALSISLFNLSCCLAANLSLLTHSKGVSSSSSTVS